MMHARGRALRSYVDLFVCRALEEIVCIYLCIVDPWRLTESIRKFSSARVTILPGLQDRNPTNADSDFHHAAAEKVSIMQPWLYGYIP
jgi:hypothetical protein